MKPKTKLQTRCLELAAKLPPITRTQRNYAIGKMFRPLAIYSIRKREVKCLNCGYVMPLEKSYIEACVEIDCYDCFQCDRSMPMKPLSEARHYYEERGLFSIITTKEDLQVIRTFNVRRINVPRNQPTEFTVDEVYQTWITINSREVITGRPIIYSPFFLGWHTDRPMDIRRHNGNTTGAYIRDDIYDHTGHLFYKRTKVLPILKRNGWTSRLLRYSGNVSMAVAMRYLLTVPTAEMLVKTGQYDLFRYMLSRELRDIPMLHAVHIANRNGYVVEDADIWLDMLQMAEELGMDTHNPKVVCPTDYIKVHNQIQARIERKRAKKDLEKKLRQILKYEGRYKKQKSKYFGLCFESDNITIRPIRSVQGIFEEGSAMHHCVFTSRYYEKPDSLILSARDKNGLRVETIELSLTTFKVLQSRGKFNSTTPYHYEIINLVNSNINQVKQCAAKN